MGEVAQQAAVLESVVAVIAWGLAGLEQPIARVVLPNDVSSMLGLIRKLLPLRVEDDALRGRVLAWCGEVREAYLKRSRVLHAVWIGDGGEGKHWRADIKPLTDKPKEEQSATDLLDIARDLELLSTVQAGEL